jgi:hypothetical protein
MAAVSSPEESVEYPDRYAYIATTLLHVRPFDALQIDLLHCCQTPLSLHALSAQMRLSPASIIWLLSSLARHGMVKRLPLSLSFAEERGEAQ